MTFAVLYSYGHLLAVAFSLSMALASAVVVLRVPSARNDSGLGLGLTLTYSMTATASALEMWLALHPSLMVGRLYLAAGGAVFLCMVVTFHLHYARELLPVQRQRAYWTAIAATSGYGFLLFLLLVSGLLDGGHVRTVGLWGARSTMPAMPVWACVLAGLYATANVPLCAELYLREGPKSRWLVSSGIWAGPFVVAWDLGICAGINPYVPLGGYLAAVVGIEGAAQLVERLRTASQPEASIAGYRLEKRLGSGGMAEVFLAHRPPMGGIDGVVQRVALKRLRTDHADDPYFVRMFLDEARILARLSHPNIVRLLDAGRAGGELYLAMELVDGATLQQIFRAANARGEHVSEAVAAEVGVQLCEALEYAHELIGDDGRALELVHRDISPQNVLVDRHGNVKLSDFGIARSADRHTETTTGFIKGKPS
ncbi:MAG: serine/threonine-protein kinase, partial [Polyangia bacterium]